MIPTPYIILAAIWATTGFLAGLILVVGLHLADDNPNHKLLREIGYSVLLTIGGSIFGCLSALVIIYFLMQNTLDNLD